MALAGVGWLICLSPLEKYLVLYIEILGIFAEASLMKEKQFSRTVLLIN